MSGWLLHMLADIGNETRRNRMVRVHSRPHGFHGFFSAACEQFGLGLALANQCSKWMPSFFARAV